MKKIIIISLVILILLIFGGIFYLNQVFLPQRVKALIIQGVEEQTNTKVTLDSVKVNIFKGLVLKGLSLSYDQGTIIKVKEASCIFIPWALLQKQIIIPSINLDTAVLFIERKSDGTFNLQDLFFVEPTAKAEPLSYVSATKAPVYAGVSPVTTSIDKGFSVSVYRVHLTNSKIIFKDSTFVEPFTKSLDNVDLIVNLSLPASLKFKLSGQIQSSTLSKINALGEFKIAEKELNTNISINNVIPKDFLPYYKNSGVNVTEGLLNALINLKLKDNRLGCDYRLLVRGLGLGKEKIYIKTNLDIKGILKYDFANNLLKQSGSVTVSEASISGLDYIEKISNINSKLTFNDGGLDADKITATVLGLPMQAKLKLTNFADPAIILNATTQVNLVSFQNILKDKFKLVFPGVFSGSGVLSFSAGGRVSEMDKLNIIGYFDFINAAVKLEKVEQPIQSINGRLAFTQDQAQWKDFNFKFQDLVYKTEGSLTDFKTPLLNIQLNSSELALLTNFVINDKLITISKCEGHYLSSDFSLSGNVDTSDSLKPNLDLGGALLLNLEDLYKFFPKLKDQLDKIKPRGKIHLQFSLAGNVNDIKSCTIEAKASSDEFSLYGLKGRELALNYNQAGGIANLPFARLSLYGGSLNASLKANMNSKNCPYLLDFGIQNVLIEELKMDTQAKDKDISGIIQGEFKANGFFNDLINSKGTGTLSISKGKLWELGLFKGLGKLLFTKDFTNIVFSEGNCALIMQDKIISTDNLILKSNVVDLSGPVSIGFDGSILAALNVTMDSDFIPSSGTLQDVTTMLLKDTAKIAVIKISGTLNDPKYKFEAAVVNIIKGLSGIFLKKKNSD